MFRKAVPPLPSMLRCASRPALPMFIFKADAVESATVETCFIASVIPCTLVLEIAAALANVPDPANLAIDRPGVNGTSRGEGLRQPQLTTVARLSTDGKGCGWSLHQGRPGASALIPSLPQLGSECTRCRGCRTTQGLRSPHQTTHKTSVGTAGLADVEYSLGARTNGCTGPGGTERAMVAHKPPSDPAKPRAAECASRCVTPPLRNGRGLARGR